LHIARLALIKARTRTLNRQRILTLAILKRQAKTRLKQLEAQIGEGNEAIAEILQSAPEIARAAEIICSIPGLSKISAAALLG